MPAPCLVSESLPSRPWRRSRLALGAACGGDSGSEASGSIRFLIFGDPAEINAYRTLIKSFNEEEPDIDVQLIEASDREDLIARLSTSIAGGSPPDLFLMNYRFYGQFAARDALEPMASYVEDSDVFEEDDFYPEALDAFQLGGRADLPPAEHLEPDRLLQPRPLQTLRGAASEGRNAVERARLPGAADDAGQERPAGARRRSRPAAGEHGPGRDLRARGRAGDHPRSRRSSGRTAREIVDDTDNPTRFTLDAVDSKQAIEQFFQLRTLHGVVPTDQDVEAEDDESRFVNGRLAMLLDSRRAVPSLREAAKFDWDVASLPYFREPASILHSDAYCMTEASDSKDAAWQLRRVRTRPRGRRRRRENGAHGPVAPLRRRVGRLPRSDSEAEELAGLPRRNRDDQARADHLHVARDRGRHERAPGERHVPRSARGQGGQGNRSEDSTPVRARRERPSASSTLGGT